MNPLELYIVRDDAALLGSILIYLQVSFADLAT